jgi:hypothetical protein
MPFYPNPPVVSVYTNPATIPALPEETIKNLPSDLSRGLTLKGGPGGDIGEKSKAAELFFSSIDLTDDIGNIQFSKDTNVNITEIVKTTKENDCGYAVQCLQDASNACTLNINLYSQFPSVNLYSRSEFFNFGGIVSGISNNAALIFNNGSFGDFTVRGKYQASIYPELDSDFGLNKYFLNLENSYTSPGNDIMLYRQLNLAGLDNLFCFYVVELDYLDGKTAFLTGDARYRRSDGSFNLDGLSSNTFLVGDRLRISSEKNIYSALGTVNSDGRLDNLKFFNSNISDFYSTYGDMPAATVGLNHPTSTDLLPPSLKFCMFAPDFQDSYFSTNKNSYFTENGSDSYELGLHLGIEKNVTYLNKEISNILYFYYDKFGLFQGDTAAPIAATINQQIERIRQRSYITDQYGSDSHKLKIKNKSKFCIIFHGIIKNNNGFKYYCGHDGGILNQSDLQVSDPFAGNAAPYLLIGNPLTKTGSGVRAYYKVKLYETLVYKNLSFNNTYNPIDLIRVNLINKYKQKLFMDASVELTANDIYYSYVDRLNILGKMKKT